MKAVALSGERKGSVLDSNITRSCSSMYSNRKAFGTAGRKTFGRKESSMVP